jgi:hypothetical protein
MPGPGIFSSLIDAVKSRYLSGPAGASLTAGPGSVLDQHNQQIQHLAPMAPVHSNVAPSSWTLSARSRAPRSVRQSPRRETHRHHRNDAPVGLGFFRHKEEINVLTRIQAVPATRPTQNARPSRSAGHRSRCQQQPLLRYPPRGLREAIARSREVPGQGWRRIAALCRSECFVRRLKVPGHGWPSQDAIWQHAPGQILNLNSACSVRS